MDECRLVFTGRDHDLRAYRIFWICDHAEWIRHPLVPDDDVCLRDDRVYDIADHYRDHGVGNTTGEKGLA